MNIRFPKVESTYLPLQGGLDLMTPAISLPPGRTFDCLNYEPEISGGYRRINGYERFDGRTTPTDNAKYVKVHIELTEDVELGMEIQGGLGYAIGTLVGLVPLDTPNHYTAIIASTVENVYFAGEEISWGDHQTYMEDGTPFTFEPCGTVIENSTTESDPALHADYQLLAVNELRNRIRAVPGDGPIRGVFSLDDIVYAFRDDGMQQKLYQATGTGWIEIEYGTELQYKSGTVALTAGDVITNGSGASATVFLVANMGGSWSIDSPSVGTVILTYGSLVGNWAADDDILVGGVLRAKATAPAAAITRSFGGRLELVKHQFPGRTGGQIIYGVDGVNLAFEFSGGSFVPIRTGITPESNDHPEHITVHANYLFVSQDTSVMHPSIVSPYAFTGFSGGEYNVGDKVTGFLPMAGGNQGAVMAIFTKSSVKLLYGSGFSNFRINNSVIDIGYAAYTIQPISGTAFGLTARGLQTLNATEVYGDFQFASISSQIQPLINLYRGREECSVVLKNKNQYRVYYGDANGHCLAVGLTGDNITGIMPLRYDRPVRCIWTDTFDGVERTFFGSDDGFVYEDNKGTSFDGEPIEAWLRLAFNHSKSPAQRKRYRRAIMEATVDSFCSVNMSYDLGYGSPQVAPPALMDQTPLVGAQGGYWDAFTWDRFVWDSQTVIAPSVTLDGTEKNISMVFYSNRAQDDPHTLQGVTMMHTQRRNER